VFKIIQHQQQVLFLQGDAQLYGGRIETAHLQPQRLDDGRGHLVRIGDWPQAH